MNSIQKKLQIALIMGGLFFYSALSLAQVEATFKLSPAGSFKAETSQVKGAAKMVGNKVVAQNIIVNLKSLKTGVGLRDDHLLKRLEVNKYPTAVLLVAEGENGKGKGKVKIRGVEKPIAGDYKVSGDKLTANFKLNLPDYKIEGVKYMAMGVKDEINVTVTVPIQK